MSPFRRSCSPIHTDPSSQDSDCCSWRIAQATRGKRPVLGESVHLGSRQGFAPRCRTTLTRRFRDRSTQSPCRSRVSQHMRIWGGKPRGLSIHRVFNGMTERRSSSLHLITSGEVRRSIEYEYAGKRHSAVRACPRVRRGRTTATTRTNVQKKGASVNMR